MPATLTKKELPPFYISGFQNRDQCDRLKPILEARYEEIYSTTFRLVASTSLHDDYNPVWFEHSLRFSNLEDASRWKGHLDGLLCAIDYAHVDRAEYFLIPSLMLDRYSGWMAEEFDGNLLRATEIVADACKPCKRLGLLGSEAMTKDPWLTKRFKHLGLELITPGPDADDGLYSIIAEQSTTFAAKMKADPFAPATLNRKDASYLMDLIDFMVEDHGIEGVILADSALAGLKNYVNHRRWPTQRFDGPGGTIMSDRPVLLFDVDEVLVDAVGELVQNLCAEAAKAVETTETSE